MNQPLYQYLPHRPPMLLLSRLISVSELASKSEVIVSEDSSFFVRGKGVPAWIGLEYMGQTAALIAGLQQQRGELTAHVGFLLGTRKYRCVIDWFSAGSVLLIECTQVARVGESLATFQGTIHAGDTELATAKLSVFRKPVE